MGASRGAHPISIVAKLNEEGLSIIFGHTKNLKGKNFSVFVQMPRELSERKKQLVPRFMEAKSNKITTKWMGDKLQVGSNTLQVKKDMLRDINIWYDPQGHTNQGRKNTPHIARATQNIYAYRIVSPGDGVLGLFCAHCLG